MSEKPRLREAAEEVLEVADLRGDTTLPHPEDDPLTWTARMQTAWDELRAALAAPEPPAEAVHDCIVTRRGDTCDCDCPGIAKPPATEAACPHTRTKRHMQPAATDDKTCLDCGAVLSPAGDAELVEALELYADKSNWSRCKGTGYGLTHFHGDMNGCYHAGEALRNRKKRLRRRGGGE